MFAGGFWTNKVCQTLAPTLRCARQVRMDTEDDTAVANQKNVAKQLLESIFKSKDSDEDKELEDAIRKALDSHMVPPIFHALVMKKDDISVFRAGGSSNREPLANKVKAGSTQEEGESGGDDHVLTGKIENLKKAVDASGKALRSMTEKFETSSAWVFDHEYAESAAELVNAQAEMLGYGVEATKVNQVFGLDPEYDAERLVVDAEENIEPAKRQHNPVLLTRPQSRGVVASCFGFRSVSLLMGTPGIGKSWTLLYALQQGLLFDEAIVLLFASKIEEVILFYRRNDIIYAWAKLHDQNKSAGSILFKSPQVLALYDPPNSGARIRQGACKMIVAMSANKKHDVKDTMKNSRGSGARFLAPPSEDELKVMLPPMMMMRAVEGSKKPTLEESMERARDIGCLPRYILDSRDFGTRKRQFDTALKKLQETTYELKHYLEGIIIMDPDPLTSWPGTIFALSGRYLPRHHHGQEDADDIDVATEQNDQSGPHNHTLLTAVDYEGRHIDYQELGVTFLTEKVLANLGSAHRETILSYWGVVDSSDFSKMGGIVESLLHSDLLTPGRIQLNRTKLVGPAADANVHDVLELSGQREEVSETNLSGWESVAHVLKDDFKVLRCPKNHALIDYAGPGKRVFQVTVGPDHTKNEQGALDLLKAAGFLGENLEESHKIGPITKKLDFYWVVPPMRYSHWAAKAPTKFQKNEQNATRMILKDCWEKYVDQYVLEIPYDSPQAIPTSNDPATVDSKDGSSGLGEMDGKLKSTDGTET
mgnify:CR=1 FL=1